MSLLPIVESPDVRLNQKSAPIKEVDDVIRQYFDNMLKTMYYEDGAGIAAVQVGILKRLLVIDVDQDKSSGITNPIFVANPEIVEISKETCKFNEGCLSFPSARLEIERPKFVKIRFLDYDNEPREIEDDGFLARVFLHEIDHLNGIVFTDYVSKLKKELALQKVAKFQKQR